MARPTQVSGDGWVADRPVGGLGRTPIPGQKWLRGKIVKIHHNRHHKRGLSCVQCRGQQNKGERRRKKSKKGSEK